MLVSHPLSFGAGRKPIKCQDRPVLSDIRTWSAGNCLGLPAGSCDSTIPAMRVLPTAPWKDPITGRRSTLSVPLTAGIAYEYIVEVFGYKSGQNIISG